MSFFALFSSFHQGSVREKEGRIEELEEALRESVKITAEREMLLMEQKMQIDALQNKVVVVGHFKTCAMYGNLTFTVLEPSKIGLVDSADQDQTAQNVQSDL